MVSLNKNFLLVFAIVALASGLWALTTLNKRWAHILPTDCVLEPGMSLTFQNQNGFGTIKYLDPCRRYFEFSNGISRAVELIPRKQPFRGKQGLYDPAEKWFYEIWKPQHRLVIEESQRHVESAEQIWAELQEGRDVYKWVWNDQGYVVGFSADPVRYQTNVSVYRFMIGNKPFDELPQCEGGFVDVLRTKNHKD